MASGTTPVGAGSLAKAAGKGAAGAVVGKAAVSGAATSNAAKAGAAHALTAAERRAYAKLLREVDQAALRRIEQRFGQHIPVGRVGQARATSTVFLSHERYQERLRAVYPHLSPAERKHIVGDFLGRPFADRNQVLLPRTVAHERLHQLRDPRFRATLGRRLDEGTTEHLASRISGDLGIRHLPKAYPAEGRIVAMMEARAGEQALARSYFRGEVEPLRQALDRQLGRGALDTVARLTRQGRFQEAEAILKHGLRGPRWWWWR